jgi:hypothetical protein
MKEKLGEQNESYNKYDQGRNNRKGIINATLDS